MQLQMINEIKLYVNSSEINADSEAIALKNRRSVANAAQMIPADFGPTNAWHEIINNSNKDNVLKIFRSIQYINESWQ